MRQFQFMLDNIGGIFWGPKGVVDIRLRLLPGEDLIVSDRQERTILTKRFLSWEGISKNHLRETYHCSCI